MPSFNDALRGYAYAILKRDGFRCVYCGLDGAESFSAWLSLSWDHLLPKGDPRRDNPEYIATACNFCNGADNWYFRKADSRDVSFTGLTREALIAQRTPYVMATRTAYREFWELQVSAVHDEVKGR